MIDQNDPLRRHPVNTPAYRFFCHLGAVTLACAMLGCAGVWTSSPPVYPADWPDLEKPAGCPDLTGRYQAVSEEAAPLTYPERGHPREMVLLVTYGERKPIPELGRRLLPWHLAGAMPRDSDLWSTLEHFSKVLTGEAENLSRNSDSGWVRVRPGSDDRIQVEAGLDGSTLLDFEIIRGRQGYWTLRGRTYDCRGGGLVIAGAFPPPPVENPTAHPEPAAAWHTFHRAVDGSLVMLEDQYVGQPEGTLVFKKWWRWRPID
jgi:hypothetical protein